MPKHYSNGAFLRRVRRALMDDGLKREVRLVEAPSYRAPLSPILIEIRTTHPDGRVDLHHHSTALPGRPLDVERITFRQRMCTGIPEDRIGDMVQELGPALRGGKENYPVVIDYGSELPPVLLVPVTLHDLIGRPHDCVVSIPFGDVPRYLERHAELQRREIKTDRVRRDRNGVPKPLLVNGLLAALLRTREDGANILDNVVQTIKKLIDAGNVNDTESKITMSTLEVVVEGLRLRVGPKGIQLKNHAVSGGVMNGSVLTLSAKLPHSVLLAIRGRRLDEIVSPAPIDGSLTITEAKPRQNGISLHLQTTSIAATDLQKELTSRSTPFKHTK